MIDREPSLGELDEKLDAIVNRIDKLPELYLSREVYEARHQALRDNLALELSRLTESVMSLKQQFDLRLLSIQNLAEKADQKAQWAIGMIATAVVGAIVMFIIRSGGGAA